LKVVYREMRFIITICLLLSVSLSGGCASGQDFDDNLRLIVKPYHFSIAKWELTVLLGGGRQSNLEREVRGESGQVVEYFSLVKRINALKSEIKVLNTSDKQGDLNSLQAELNKLEGQREVLEALVAGLIEKQIKETLAEQGIFSPVDEYVRLKDVFPPVNFKFEQPPNLLVISPRDRIESIREGLLSQSISLEEVEDIEAEVDKLGVSSLVVKLGGFGGTYPTFVANDASLRFTLDTATEEWLHQYLVFKPLGFLYLLDSTGVSRNYDIATMNETVAGIVSKEIGAQKRQYLASKGYYIRKLNQAYFAFHGTYADKPTSISPIGVELKLLRSQSASLKDFLNTAAAMTSRQDLLDSIS